MMHRHLRQILDTHFPSEAARTHFTAFGAKFSPENELAQLRSTCMRTLEFNSQYGASVIAEHVSEMVKRLYYALSGTNVAFDPQVPTKYGEVITDRVYRDQHEIKVLWDDKAPAVFDRFIEPLQEQITTHESVPGLWSEPSSVTFDGYEAILSKVRVIVSVSGI
jgi:hypothetical protein